MQAHTCACKHMCLERQGQGVDTCRDPQAHHTLLAHVAAGPELPTRLRFAEGLMALLQAQSQALLSPALVLLRDVSVHGCCRL